MVLKLARVEYLDEVLDKHYRAGVFTPEDLVGTLSLLRVTRGWAGMLKLVVGNFCLLLLNLLSNLIV